MDSGRTHLKPKKTIQAAVDRASPLDVIMVAPGEYDEEITVPVDLTNLRIFGWGGRGAAYVEPSDTNATGLTNLADDLTVVNLGLAGAGTGDGILNYGARLRGYRCKIEGGTNGLYLALGTIAQIAAGTHGKGADIIMDDCEFTWNTNGVILSGTDYGAITQPRFRRCLFHDNSAADFEEASGSGGGAGVRYRDLDIDECKFRRQEDGTEPAKYISLNDDNTNSGVVSGCQFPTALAGGKNLVSTGLIWTGNYHTDGVSAAQPS